MACHVFLGAHGFYYGLGEKYKRLEKGGANPFVDPEGYRSYIAEREQAFLDELARQQKEAASTAPKR